MRDKLQSYCNDHHLSYAQILEFIRFSQASLTDFGLVKSVTPVILTNKDEAKVIFENDSHELVVTIQKSLKFFLCNQNVLCLPYNLEFIYNNSNSRNIYGLIHQLTNSEKVDTPMPLNIVTVSSLIHLFLTQTHILNQDDFWIKTQVNKVQIESKLNGLQISIYQSIEPQSDLNILIQLNQSSSYLRLINYNQLFTGDDLNMSYLLEYILILCVDLVQQNKKF